MKIKSSVYPSHMKNLVSAVLFSLLLISCGNSKEQSVDDVIETNDLEEIQAKKRELSQQQSLLASQLDKLDAAITKLDPNKSLPLVITTTVDDTLFQHFTVVQGEVATNENIIIYPEFSGVLERVFVKDGDKVRKGQVLARIDEGGLSSQLAQLETRATLAKTTFERQKRLWDQNIGSEIQFLEAQTNYEAAQNAVNQLKTQLDKTNVRAPFSGVIDEVISDEGLVVNPGQNQLFRLVNLDNMYVQAAVPENYLSQISKGTSVLVELSAIGKQFKGTVRQVGNFINPNNRTFQIEIAIPNEEGLLKPNLIATVKLNDYSAENAIIIPENSIQKNSMGENLVFVFEPETDSTGLAKKIPVELGYTSRDSVEVTQGLQPGDRLIVQGARNLRDNQKVQIQN